MAQANIGHIVHYVGGADTDPPCAAAIITAVGDYPPGTPSPDPTMCPLRVFPPEQHFEAHSIRGHERGTWHWPEHTDA